MFIPNITSVDSPEIIIITNNSTFVSNTNRYLKCVAQGYPRPRIHWRSDAIVYDDSHYSLASYTSHTLEGSVFVTSVLTLNPVYPDHHGTYTCIANNSLGEHHHSVDVTVLCEIHKYCLCMVHYYVFIFKQLHQQHYKVPQMPL